jgi:quinolinate synthase
VCTSSNAPKILEWSFAQREKVLFFPDQHLGRWSGHKMGIPLDEMVVWDPDLENGGLTAEQIRRARILLWKGHCSVHQMFQAGHILRFRNEHPDGLVISHPESNFDVCRLSDHVGSTEFIIKTIKAAEPGTRWLVGTELNLVSRLAEEVKPEGKVVQFMAPMVCMCSTMGRIDPQHLAWCLENLAEGNVVNRIRAGARGRAGEGGPQPHARRLVTVVKPAVTSRGKVAAPRQKGSVRKLRMCTYNIHKGFSQFKAA